MAKQLKDVVNIRLRAVIESSFVAEEKDFDNYFQTFKKPLELQEDYFCSPIFQKGNSLSLAIPYGDRVNAKETIRNVLKGKECISIHLSYDFRFAAVNEEYYTEGEFEFVKSLLEEAVQETNLYLVFLVSHFSQILRHSPLRYKPEHYHILICKKKGMGQKEYKVSIDRFVNNLCKNSNVDVFVNE